MFFLNNNSRWHLSLVSSLTGRWACSNEYDPLYTVFAFSLDDGQMAPVTHIFPYRARDQLQVMWFPLCRFLLTVVGWRSDDICHLCHPLPVEVRDAISTISVEPDTVFPNISRLTVRCHLLYMSLLTRQGVSSNSLKPLNAVIFQDSRTMIISWHW